MNGVLHCLSLFVATGIHTLLVHGHTSLIGVYPCWGMGGDRGVLCDDNTLLHYVINLVDSVPTVA